MKAVIGRTDSRPGTSLVVGLGGSAWSSSETSWTSAPKSMGKETSLGFYSDSGQSK